jgi:hypothetical protein
MLPGVNLLIPIKFISDRPLNNSVAKGQEAARPGGLPTAQCADPPMASSSLRSRS